MTRPELVDAITALDLITLFDRRIGDDAPLDPETHRVAVAETLKTGQAVTVWHGDALAAYAVFIPRGEGVWFATGIALHPDLAGPGTIRQLRDKIADFLRGQDVAWVESNVFRSNLKSVALHRRLGFEVFRENEHGFAFAASAEHLRAQLAR